MKNTVLATITGILLVIAVVAFGQQFAVTTPPGALSGCPSPAAGVNILCSVTDGYYASIAGSAYVKINATAGGVATFNGRSGNVMPAASDYSFSQIGGQITPAQLPATISLNCPTFTQSNTGTTLNKCTITTP